MRKGVIVMAVLKRIAYFLLKKKEKKRKSRNSDDQIRLEGLCRLKHSDLCGSNAYKVGVFCDRQRKSSCGKKRNGEKANVLGYMNSMRKRKEREMD